MKQSSTRMSRQASRNRYSRFERRKSRRRSESKRKVLSTMPMVQTAVPMPTIRIIRKASADGGSSAHVSLISIIWKWAKVRARKEENTRKSQLKYPVLVLYKMSMLTHFLCSDTCEIVYIQKEKWKMEGERKDGWSVTEKNVQSPGRKAKFFKPLKFWCSWKLTKVLSEAYWTLCLKRTGFKENGNYRCFFLSNKLFPTILSHVST